MEEIDHKTMQTADILRLLGELEHLRGHALQATTMADEDKILELLVLANECQVARRKLQKRYFPNVPETYWCMVKSASRLMQLSEETGNREVDELKDVKNIIDSAIRISTGEDISGCSACRTDKGV